METDLWCQSSAGVLGISSSPGDRDSSKAWKSSAGRRAASVKAKKTGLESEVIPKHWMKTISPHEEHSRKAAQSHKQQTKLNQQRHEWIEQASAGRWTWSLLEITDVSQKGGRLYGNLYLWKMRRTLKIV